MINYNILHLQEGFAHVTDEVFRDIVLDNYGYEIPEEDLHTPRVNDYYISMNEEVNSKFLKKNLVKRGLYDGETNE